MVSKKLGKELSKIGTLANFASESLIGGNFIANDTLSRGVRVKRIICFTF